MRLRLRRIHHEQARTCGRGRLARLESDEKPVRRDVKDRRRRMGLHRSFGRGSSGHNHCIRENLRQRLRLACRAWQRREARAGQVDAPFGAGRDRRGLSIERRIGNDERRRGRLGALTHAKQISAAGQVT